MAPKAGRGSDQFVVRLPDGMRERLKEAAEYSGRSMNAEVVQALDSWLDGVDHSRELERYYTENPPEMPGPGDIVDDTLTDDDLEKWAEERIIRSPEDIDRAVEQILREQAYRLRAGMVAAFRAGQNRKDKGAPDK
ncbi:Arc family DNA-binding protein [Paracoccus pantotrophus]|uniref:Arc family DNA-binding protein n=1 Tax=Paracoccus pantotrophus TaxID=82367 RepID=UPI0035B4FA62